MLNSKALAASASAPKIYIEECFQSWLYTGNGSTQTITNGIDLSGKGGLVWTKYRSGGSLGTSHHALIDTARGATKALSSSLTSAEQTFSDSITAFGSTGYTLGADASSGRVNYGTGETYASWTFRKAAKFFDVVTYTGNGVDGRDIPHNLGSVPGCIIIKRTDVAADWLVLHRSSNNYQDVLFLNRTDAATNASSVFADQTSTYFSVSSGSNNNASGGTYVAYLFAHDAGGFGDSGNESVVKCGSFTTDGSGNTTVDLGWEPQWLLLKPSAILSNWFVLDSMRGLTVRSDGSSSGVLKPNLSDAESALGIGSFSPSATGFSVTAQAPSRAFIYIAIRRGPMKTPTDATKVFDADAVNIAEGIAVTTGFPIDLQVSKYRGLSLGSYWVDRLRGVSTVNSTQNLPYLTSPTTDAETTGTLTRGWSNTGFQGSSYYSGSDLIHYSFRRAPGFFDVVAYTGTGSARTVSHNLGVVPELMIVKVRDTAYKWIVYSSSLGNTQFVVLNETTAATTSSITWNDTTPTSSVFTLGTSAFVNGSGNTYIAYLFASCPGVSKVGSYTGTGTTQQINCGFTAGSRFVLIKRTDSTGDWYVWDSARGIVAGNDPYLLLNSTAAEVTSTDYIDTYSAGFEISSTAPAAINANGGSFIFLAIA